MNTELPRAETLSGLEAEREAGRQLVSMRILFQAADAVYEGLKVWLEENPEPSKENWEATPEGVAWVNLLDEESKRLRRANGFPDDDEENLKSNEKMLEQMNTVLEPRSSIYQCLNDYKCDQTNSDENELAPEMVLMREAFKEAILNNANTIAELVENSKELATVTCNNNGFYE